MSRDFREFQDLLDSFKEVQKQHEAFLRKFLTEMGMRALAQTKKLTPVDSGNLRNRWELSEVYRKGDSLYIVLFNPVEYASFVEDGHMQRRRFLPIQYLEDSPANAKMVASIKQKYGDDIQGVMLHDKWIPGHHMARISISKIEREIPKRYEKALKQFMKRLGAGD
jgi:hypothetical protein